MVDLLLQRPFAAVTSSLDGDVLLVLARADASFTGGELARMIPSASAEGVRKAVKRLVEHGLVSMEPIGSAHTYRLNREHLLADAVVSIARADEIFYARAREHVSAWPRSPEAVILYGSAARGEMEPDSDLDLLVVADPDDTIDASMADLARAASSWTGNDARVVNLSPQEVRRDLADGDPLIGELVRDGHVLWGPTRYLQRLRREVLA